MKKTLAVLLMMCMAFTVSAKTKYEKWKETAKVETLDTTSAPKMGFHLYGYDGLVIEVHIGEYGDEVQYFDVNGKMLGIGADLTKEQRNSVKEFMAKINKVNGYQPKPKEEYKFGPIDERTKKMIEWENQLAKERWQRNNSLEHQFE